MWMVINVRKRTKCPDCGQKLNEPQRPCGKIGDRDLWCATCEDARPNIFKLMKLPPIPIPRIQL